MSAGRRPHRCQGSGGEVCVATPECARFSRAQPGHAVIHVSRSVYEEVDGHSGLSHCCRALAEWPLVDWTDRALEEWPFDQGSPARGAYTRHGRREGDPVALTVREITSR